MLQQAYTPSNTGIASFVHASADYDLAPIGIGSMKEQADRVPVGGVRQKRRYIRCPRRRG
jgi:hypothetical protein